MPKNARSSTRSMSSPPTATMADPFVGLAPPPLPSLDDIHGEYNSGIAEVPRAPNSFILFKSWVRSWGTGQAKDAATFWVSLKATDPGVEAHFKSLAEQAKQKHEAAFPDYRYKPRKRKERKTKGENPLEATTYAGGSHEPPTGGASQTAASGSRSVVGMSNEGNVAGPSMATSWESQRYNYLAAGPPLASTFGGQTGGMVEMQSYSPSGISSGECSVDSPTAPNDLFPGSTSAAITYPLATTVPALELSGEELEIRQFNRRYNINPALNPNEVKPDFSVNFDDCDFDLYVHDSIYEC